MNYTLTKELVFETLRAIQSNFEGMFSKGRLVHIINISL